MICLMRCRNSLGARGERNLVLVSGLHWIAIGEKCLGFLAWWVIQCWAILAFGPALMSAGKSSAGSVCPVRSMRRMLFSSPVSKDERIQHLATTLYLRQRLVPETMKRYRGEELGRLIARLLTIMTGILHCAKQFAILKGASERESPYFNEMNGRVNVLRDSVSE